MNKHTRWTLPWFTAALLVTLILGACGSDSGDGEGENVKVGDWGGVINRGGDPVRGGTLRIDQFSPPQGISPIFFLDQPELATIPVVMQMFDQLVELLPGSLDPKPGLAESWEISDDGKTYTFHLRDAQFSNGMPVTSADVKFTLERAKKSFFIGLFGVISKIETPDDSTVVLRLATPAPGMLEYLTFPGASIVPAKVVKSMGEEEFNKKPIGSGPFVLKRWRRDQDVVLGRNESYWRKGQPYLDEVRLVATPNDNTRVLNAESGTVDVADFIPFSQIERINRQEGVKVLVVPSTDRTAIFFNNAKKPYTELAVRQALNYATPVESIIKTVFAGEAPRANTTMPKLKYWTEKAKAYPFDIERAKQVLAETSVPSGFATTLKIVGDDQASNQIAQIVKESWAEIGVEVTIETVPPGGITDAFVKGGYETILSTPGEFTSDVPVDDEFATLMFNSPETFNLFTWYENPTTAKLAGQAVVELDEDERARLFEQLHVESMKNPGMVPIVYTPNRAAVRDNVHDFNYLLNGVWRLESVWVD